ncbi:MAG: hypothetical protein C6W56_13185 [Caldibacillus debilis]|nr:MAG: hypothetical protein C6W56_13185 [Caldibacillus debilis]
MGRPVSLYDKELTMRVFLSRTGALPCYRARAGEESFSSPFAAGGKRGSGCAFPNRVIFLGKARGGAGAANGEARLHLSGRMPRFRLPGFPVPIFRGIRQKGKVLETVPHLLKSGQKNDSAFFRAVHHH